MSGHGRLVTEAQGLRLAPVLFAAYPRESALVIALLVLAGLAEGIGVASILPLLEAFTSGGAVAGSDAPLNRLIRSLFAAVNLEPTLLAMLVAVVLGMTLKAGLVLLAMSQVGLIMARVGHRLRLTFLRAMMRAQWGYFTRQPIGALANAINTESNGASAAFLAVAHLAAAALQVAVYMALAFLISWQVTAAAVLAGVVLFVALNRLVTISRRAGRQAVSAFQELISRLVDGLAGIKAIKAMGQEDRLGPMLEVSNESLYRAQRRLVVSKEALVALHEPIIVIFLALGLFAMAEWFPAPVDMLIMTALLFQRTVTRLGRLQGAYQQLVAAQGYFASISAKIADATAQAERSSGRPAPPLRHDLKLRRVNFAYGEKRVLADVSLEAPAGRLTALYGPSGSGKTTLADLVLGLTAPQSGQVLIDGEPLQELDLASWRRRIGYVPQELFLFHDTVLNNVTLGDPTLSRGEAERALRDAGAWDFVAALDGGMESIVGERGAKLSGGQRQRIAIARALVRRPRLLILDEPTTALDPSTEAEICQTLRALSGEVTILAISHQPAIVAIADVVYRMRDGRAELIEPRVAAAAL